MSEKGDGGCKKC
jgi:hypothetical protein